MFHLGTDIIEIDRIKSACLRGKQRFLDRLFSVTEQEYCNRMSNPFPHFAVRFAAKEALLKAAGSDVRGLFKWVELCVDREDSGAPRYALTGKAKAYFLENGLKTLSLSLSHSREYALAVALVEKGPQSNTD